VLHESAFSAAAKSIFGKELPEFAQRQSAFIRGGRKFVGAGNSALSPLMLNEPREPTVSVIRAAGFANLPFWYDD